MKTRRTILALCVVLLGLILLFTACRSRISGLTRRVEQAGGFVGSVQPPDWMNPIYDLVCRLDLFCEPYQIILDRDDAFDKAVPAAQGLHHLRILEFEDATIPRTTLDRIKTMRQLKNLEFRRCSLPTGAVDELRVALPDVKVLEQE